MSGLVVTRYGHDVPCRRIEVVEVTTDAPSPFAAGVSWRRTNTLMYEDDAPLSDAATADPAEARHEKPGLQVGPVPRQRPWHRFEVVN